MQPIDRLTVIGRTYRHLNRYQQIVRVLFRYGFGDLLDTLHVRRYIEAVLSVISSREEAKQVQAMSRPVKVRRVLEELGPTFVKLGQVLSTRPDLIPLEYVVELSKLQDRVPPFSVEAAEVIIREELGGRPAEVFAEFDETPAAAASIAQGHHAVLKDGTEVFVKIQRPGIRKLIEADLEIMMHLAVLVENNSEELAVLKPSRIVAEFRRTLEKEVDFSIEAVNMQRFARQFRRNSTVYVPKVFEAYSSGRVLTQEYIRGIKASNLEALKATDADLPLIASRGADLLMEQFFDHGFFHADPHPGNIYVLPGNVICYVDFGMMGRLGRSEREDLGELLMLAVSRDERRAVPVIMGLTTWDKEPDRTELERDLADFIDEHMYRSLGSIDVGRILQQLYSICHRHGLTLRPHIYLMLKTMGTVDEMGRHLNPDFEVLQHLKPFVRKMRLRRLSPIRIAQEMMRTGSECADLLQDLPSEIRAVLRQVREGHVKVEFEHKGLDGMLQTHERISNRISYAIVLAALIVGSSLMTLSDIPPKWNGMPIIGIGGFVVAALLGFWLLWSILRSGQS